MGSHDFPFPFEPMLIRFVLHHFTETAFVKVTNNLYIAKSQGQLSLVSYASLREHLHWVLSLLHRIPLTRSTVNTGRAL